METDPMLRTMSVVEVMEARYNSYVKELANPSLMSDNQYYEICAVKDELEFLLHYAGKVPQANK